VCNRDFSYSFKNCALANVAFLLFHLSFTQQLEDLKRHAIGSSQPLELTP